MSRFFCIHVVNLDVAEQDCCKIVSFKVAIVSVFLHASSSGFRFGFNILHKFVFHIANSHCMFSWDNVIAHDLGLLNKIVVGRQLRRRCGEKGSTSHPAR